MTWLETVDFLKGQGAVVDDAACVNVTLQGVGLRVSWSKHLEEVGILADVATARGLTPREIVSAGAAIPHGKLIVVSERILLCHLAPVAPLAPAALAVVLSSMASQVVTMRLRWTMPQIAA